MKKDIILRELKTNFSSGKSVSKFIEMMLNNGRPDGYSYKETLSFEMLSGDSEQNSIRMTVAYIASKKPSSIKVKEFNAFNELEEIYNSESPEGYHYKDTIFLCYEKDKKYNRKAIIAFEKV